MGGGDFCLKCFGSSPPSPCAVACGLGHLTFIGQWVRVGVAFASKQKCSMQSPYFAMYRARHVFVGIMIISTVCSHYTHPYNAHPYFPLKNSGQKVHIIHSKIWYLCGLADVPWLSLQSGSARRQGRSPSTSQCNTDKK